MLRLKKNEENLLSVVALKLGVNRDDLYKLINFESRWNPLAKNPFSSARGLIQFTDNTARELGYSDSLDLVEFNPTITDQLPIVEKYLSRYKPFRSKQALYLSVFYPAARNWSPLQPFSAAIQKVNPGIRTPNDYIKMVEGGAGKYVALIVAAVVSIFFLNRFKWR